MGNTLVCSHFRSEFGAAPLKPIREHGVMQVIDEFPLRIRSGPVEATRRLGPPRPSATFPLRIRSGPVEASLRRCTPSPPTPHFRSEFGAAPLKRQLRLSRCQFPHDFRSEFGAAPLKPKGRR